MQDRDIVTMEDYLEIVCGPSNGVITFDLENDLQGHFCCLKLRRLTAENLCPSATVVRVHNGAPGGVIRGVINNTGGSRRWLIINTVQLTATRFVAREFVDDAHGIACPLCNSYA